MLRDVRNCSTIVALWTTDRRLPDYRRWDLITGMRNFRAAVVCFYCVFVVGKDAWVIWFCRRARTKPEMPFIRPTSRTSEKTIVSIGSDAFLGTQTRSLQLFLVNGRGSMLK